MGGIHFADLYTCVDSLSRYLRKNLISLMSEWWKCVSFEKSWTLCFSNCNNNNIFCITYTRAPRLGKKEMITGLFLSVYTLREVTRGF